MQPCGHVFLESENLTSTNSVSCQFLDLSLTYCSDTLLHVLTYIREIG